MPEKKKEEERKAKTIRFLMKFLSDLWQRKVIRCHRSLMGPLLLAPCFSLGRAGLPNLIGLISWSLVSRRGINNTPHTDVYITLEKQRMGKLHFRWQILSVTIVFAPNNRWSLSTSTLHYRVPIVFSLHNHFLVSISLGELCDYFTPNDRSSLKLLNPQFKELPLFSDPNGEYYILHLSSESI